MRFTAPDGSLAQDAGVGGGVVGLHHVDGKGVVHVGVAQTVGDVGLGLAVAGYVLDVQVQQIVVLLEQRLIGRAQEVVGGVVDVQPDILGRMRRRVELVGDRLIGDGGIQEALVVLGGDGDVQGVVAAGGLVCRCRCPRRQGRCAGRGGSGRPARRRAG